MNVKCNLVKTLYKVYIYTVFELSEFFNIKFESSTRHTSTYMNVYTLRHIYKRQFK